MMQLFVVLVNETNAQLHKALSENDLQTIQKAAHKIKPTIEQLGIVSIKDVVYELETYKTKTDINAEIAEKVNRLIAVLEKVSRDFEAKTN